MLHSISWARFGAFIIIILVIYYGYLLLRFYGRELLALVGVGMGGRDGITEDMVTVKKDKEAVGVGKGDGVQGGSASGESAEQGSIFPERPAAGVGETPELFKVMEKVVMLLRQVVTEAAATGVRREELEDRIRMILSGYRQLVKTPYQVSINNFIQRSCSTTFSLLLSDKEVTGLWEV